MVGETPDPSEEYRRQQESYDRQWRERNGDLNRTNEPRYQTPPLLKINYYIEHGNLPENREVLRADYRKAGIELFDPLLRLQRASRTRFDTNDFSDVRAKEMLDRYAADFQQSIQGVESFAELGSLHGPEMSALAKVMDTDLVRTGAFHNLELHTVGFKFFYFDAKGAFSLLATGRRHGAINTEDWMAMFSPLEGSELTTEEKEALKIPETEHVGEQVSKMTSDIDHFERAIGAMNRYNPNRPSGKEMFMEISGTEQKMLGELFVISDKSDTGESVGDNFEPKSTQKITVTVREGGADVKKSFYTNLLSYYVTADPEKDRRIYEATMKALAEVNAFDRLKSLPGTTENLVDNTDAGVRDGSKYHELVKDIEDTRNRILKNWNSYMKPFRSRLADYAYEQNFNIQTGTQNVAELAYRFVWKKVNGKWDYTVEIPGPEIGQDAVNGRNPLVHELTYKVLKGRGVSAVMPWPKHGSVQEMIKIALMETRGKDPKPIILSRPGLAKGAATIGLYPGEAERKLSNKDLEEVAKTRKDMVFNPTALRVLDSMLWIYDLSADGTYLPMPIKPAYDSMNLLKVMRDGVTKRTVFEMLHDKGVSLRDIDYSNITWYQGDAWEVNMKMIEDVIQIMYGRQDPKYVGGFLEDKVGGIGEMIKKMDIGTRAEGWKLEVRKSLDPRSSEYNKYETIDVPKGFIEIMQVAYLIVTNEAIVKHKIWDFNGWRQENQKQFWEGIQSWVTVAHYEPETKGEFTNYRDTMVLMIIAIAEWYADAAAKHSDDAVNLKDKVNVMTPASVSYDMPRN